MLAARGRGARALLAALSLILLAILASCGTPEPGPVSATQPPASATLAAPSPSAAVTLLHGFVLDADGPLACATVRLRATDNRTETAGDGSFTLAGLSATIPVSVTAWAEGYYVGWASAAPGPEPVTMTLRPYYTTDNPDYAWFSMEGAEGSRTCGHCMPGPYAGWIADAHSQSATNPRFLTMYNGTDVHGNQSPPTRYASSRDYGSFPLRPDPDQPYFGPGYKLDFPNTAGNCATCHVPAAAARPGMAYAADPNEATGVEAEGVFCEFCHKIGGVTLDPSTGLPYANMPGVLSTRLYRSEGDQVLFFGTLDDVTRRVSRLPLEEESAFCAPCHYGVFWDTVVYDSFGEWLRSPYSDPDTGQTCQDCHMPVTEETTFVLPEQGGLERPAGRVFDHRMPGAMDEEFLQNAVTVSARGRLEEGAVVVEVSITNDRTGHHVPTDSPLRHLILVVQATDPAGRPLALLEGPTVPDWGGVGDAGEGYYAGLPGKGYAKILQELWTEISPSGAYWNPTRIVSDSRIVALATDTSEYRFAAAEDGQAVVGVKLIFRRAFIELMDQKGWEVPDIVMAELHLTVPAQTR